MYACVYGRTTISTRRERIGSIRMESKLMMTHSWCFVVWVHILQAVETIILGEYCRKRLTTKVTVHAALNAFVAKGRAARFANHIDDVLESRNAFKLYSENGLLWHVQCTICSITTLAGICCDVSLRKNITRFRNTRKYKICCDAQQNVYHGVGVHRRIRQLRTKVRL